MFTLSCLGQNYAWGKFGEDSQVARLLKGFNASLDIGSTVPYAELWMGTHVSGPSRISNDGSLLSDWLKANPHAVGTVPQDYPEDDLPFLFKVLSIRTALSIQSHPDKALAKELFATRPDIYKDPNHKPEMAIALTPFQAMCGFRPIYQIQNNLIKYPELANVIGDDATSAFLNKEVVNDMMSEESKKAALKNLFWCFMDCDADKANTEISSIVSRLRREQTVFAVVESGEGETLRQDTYYGEESDSAAEEPLPLTELILQLNEDFPNDKGVFCPLLLNTLKLSPGEGFFMGANEPHAYISGDCVECMALSDNVIRAALTPKYKDVDTLCNSLHYRSGTTEMSRLVPVILDDFTTLYRPPADMCAEFEVERSIVPAGTASYKPPHVSCGSIILVLKGRSVAKLGEQSIAFQVGTVLYVAANEDIVITPDNDFGEDVEFYRAHVNLG